MQGSVSLVMFARVPMRAFSIIALVFSTGLLSIVTAQAQVTDPVTAAQAPVPGAGHNYIGVGAETVNPADGSVTFDLPIQTPAGRGLSFPFAIHFSESAPFYIGQAQANSSFGWTAPNQYQNPPFSSYGWSYALPNYVAQARVSNVNPSPNGYTQRLPPSQTSRASSYAK